MIQSASLKSNFSNLLLREMKDPLFHQQTRSQPVNVQAEALSLKSTHYCSTEIATAEHKTSVTQRLITALF